jgi:hypothetical protein
MPGWSVRSHLTAERTRRILRGGRNRIHKPSTFLPGRYQTSDRKKDNELRLVKNHDLGKGAGSPRTKYCGGDQPESKRTPVHRWAISENTPEPVLDRNTHESWNCDQIKKIGVSVQQILQQLMDHTEAHEDERQGEVQGDFAPFFSYPGSLFRSG